MKQHSQGSAPLSVADIARKNEIENNLELQKRGDYIRDMSIMVDTPDPTIDPKLGIGVFDRAPTEEDKDLIIKKINMILGLTLM